MKQIIFLNDSNNESVFTSTLTLFMLQIKRLTFNFEPKAFLKLVYPIFFLVCHLSSIAQLPSVGLVKDINPGTTGSSPNGMIKLGSNLIYAANGGNGNELWKTDGTQAGTVLIKDINTSTATASSSPSNFVLMGSFIYFTANDGVNGGALWRTDGTSAGTTMVKDIKAGSTTSSSGISELKAIGTKLYFRGDDGVNGTEPWISDGTAAGTTILKNISPTGSSSGAVCACFGTFEFVEFNGFVYFNASDEAGSFAQNSELWRTDGTTAGTNLFIDNYAFGGGGPGNLVNAGSYLFFTSDNQANTGFEPWKTDGTVGGTTMIKDVFNLANVGSITGDVPTAFMNGYVYFVAVDVYDPANFNLVPPQSGYINAELWRTNGTSTGTTKVKEINPGMSGLTADANPANFLVVGNTLYFTATDGTNGVELWKTDGTAVNTVMVKDIALGSESSSPTNLTLFNGFIYFYASNGASINGKELWRTDGTAANTVMVKDIRAGNANSSVGSFAALNSTHLMFAANNGIIGSELYMLGGPIVTVTTSANGKTDPPGVASSSSTYDIAFVNGSNASFTFTPDAGNSIQSVLADAGSVGTPANYTFSNITSNHTLNVTYGVGTPCTPPSITTAASSNSPICSGAALNLSVAASGTAPLTYSWAGAGTITNGNTATSSVTGSATGNYVVTITNACGSTNSTAAVTVRTLSTAPSSITGISTICNGSSTTLTQSGGALGTGASYQWYTGPNGTGSLAGTGPSITVSPATSTSYYVRAEGICNNTADASILVTVNSLSSAPTSISGFSTICNGASTTLTQLGGALGTGASFKWYTGPNGTGSLAGTGPSITVSPASTTSYYVRAEGICNNTADASILVTVNSLSSAPTSITGNTTICNGSSTTLTQSGGALGAGALYKWYTGSCGASLVGTGSSITVSPSSNTTYYVRAEGTCNNTPCSNTTVTVNATSSSSTAISNIGCYTWPLNNATYSASGSYTASFTNSNNCDSIVTLNLTILPGIYLNAKAFLSGPYFVSTGLMNDSLRQQGLIPTTEPYSSSPYNKSVISETNGETVSNSILNQTGNNAIVDWIFIELRSATNPATIIATKRALIQRDGDIVSHTDGLSPVFFATVSPGNYYVSIKHRNHLGVMTNTALLFGGCAPTSIDYSSISSVYTNSTIANAPRKLIGSVYALWPGDANNNKNTKYNGISNDKDFILTALGGAAFINNVLSNIYRVEDCNMDGFVKYNNVNSDRVVILDNVGTSTPNNVLNQHTPN